MKSSATRIGMLLATCLALSTWVGASNVRHMNLEALTANAGFIFSGEVVETTLGTVWAGGAEFPTVTYRFKLEASYKGDTTELGGDRYVEMTMLGRIDNQTGDPNLHFRSILPELPQLRVGQHYLIFSTTPSSIGLSTTVGLGQGCFRIFDQGPASVALNLNHNAGLFLNMDNAVTKKATKGPIAFDELVGMVQTEMKRGGQ